VVLGNLTAAQKMFATTFSRMLVLGALSLCNGATTDYVPVQAQRPQVTQENKM
jgi:hypothetical protein